MNHSLNKKYLIHTFFCGAIGFIFGSFINSMHLESLEAKIHVPYFDLLIYGEDYLIPSIRNIESFPKKYTPEYKNIMKMTLNHQIIDDDEFYKVISSGKFNPTNGDITFAVPFYYFIGRDGFNGVIDSLVSNFNMTSASKYRYLKKILEVKEYLLANGSYKGENNIKIYPNISLVDYEKLRQDVSRIKGILSVYEVNGYWASYSQVYPVFTVGLWSFKFSMLFILIGSFIFITPLRKYFCSLFLTNKN